MFNNLRAQASEIIDEVISNVYFMRGAINYFDYFEMTRMERQRISTFLEKRFKEESKKPPHVARVY